MSRRVFFLVGCMILLIFQEIGAQSRKELETKRQQLLQQIELTSKKLGKTSEDIGSAMEDIKALKAEISTRQRLISNLEQEMSLIDNQLGEENRRLEANRQELQALKENYAQMLQTAYISRQLENPLLFLLSAQNLNQAFQRWQYLQQIERHRKRQYERLTAATDSLRVIIGRIDKAKADKESARSTVLTQQKQSSQAAARQEELVGKLKSDEKTLRQRLKNQEEESRKLAAEIDRIIKAEMAKSSSAEAMPNAPALAKLTASFTENRGKLPWPVKKGVITGKFGNQPHPVLKTITITNNGIDFTVEDGTEVFSVFDGVVVGQKFIPGFDEMLIIQHGKYYTVYSRLSTTYVKKGDKVTTQQRIGRASSGSGKSQIHFELWQEKTLLDPEKWLLD